MDFLDNDYPCRIYSSGYTYGSITHAVEAAKVLDMELKMDIRSCKTGEEARKLAEGLSIRKDWEQIREITVRGFLAQKFYSTPGLKDQLKAISAEDVTSYFKDQNISKLILDIKSKMK